MNQSMNKKETIKIDRIGITDFRTMIKENLRYVWILLAVISIFTVVSAPMTLYAQEDLSDMELLEKAKLNLFDRKWDRALKQLDQLITNYPESKRYDLALFYKGKCQEELKQAHQALATYTKYLAVSENDNLKEEATIAIIDLNFRLYKMGDHGYLKQIPGFLDSRQKTVRYYAAFKLSYADDKETAKTAVPVLKRIVANENDEELVDRAKLALMRIDPKYLKETAKKRNMAKRMLFIRAYDHKSKKEVFSLSIPFALARLALESLPDKNKQELEKEGYNIDRILETMVDHPEVLRISLEDTTFKIWIE